ncbi:hypothetical protein KY285_030390 [Solanum tuberosum]|nr:hypothetical protein KY285_030390 [Solanum tuberosum]
MELSIASHGKVSPFADLTKEKKEFKKGMTSKIQTEESMAVKETSVKFTTKNKLKGEEAPSQYPKEESKDETKESKGEHNATITQEHQANEKVTPCCATIAFTDDDLFLGSKIHNRPLFVVGSIREQHLNCILINGGSEVNIMPKVVLKNLGVFIDELSKSNLTIQDAKTSYNLLLERLWVHENGVVPSTLHQCMNYMKDSEVVKIDADINPFTETKSYFADEKFYLDSERSNMEEHAEADSIDLEDSKIQWAAIKMSKKRTEQVSIKFSPSKGDMQNNIDDEQPIFLYITLTQVPSITLEPSKDNTRVGKIKGNFDEKVLTLFEKSGYNFSNPAKLRELRDEVTGEKMHRLTKSQILTPRVSAFERLGHKDERETSKQVDGYATTSKTSVFHRLGTKRKSLSERRLLEHENQDFCDVTDDKEIHSVFPSRMKRKVILSITTDESLKIKRTTIIVTNHFNGETKKEEDEAITIFVGSQREDSNLIQSSYHITVEEGPHIDDTNDDVQEAPPQLEDGVQSTIDDLKELNLGTLEDPHPTFVSALLTPEEERKLIE